MLCSRITSPERAWVPVDAPCSLSATAFPRLAYTKPLEKQQHSGEFPDVPVARAPQIQALRQQRALILIDVRSDEEIAVSRLSATPLSRNARMQRIQRPNQCPQPCISLV